MLAKRYADCLRRLASSTAVLGHPSLDAQLRDVAWCLERLAPEIAASDGGPEVLARAARLIGVTEALVADQDVATVLH